MNGPDVETKWPEAKVEKMRELAAQGHSAAQIARAMGVSRNAVMGKCYRRQIALISQAAVGGWVKTDFSKKAVKPTLAHLDVIKAADAVGESIPDVMAKTGLGYSQISKLRQDMGLKKKKTARQAQDDVTIHRMKARINNPVPVEVDIQQRFCEGYLGQKGRVSIYQLTDGVCKFPIDQADGGLPRFCGEPCLATKSWCAHHFERCTGGQYKPGGHFKLAPMAGRTMVAA